MLFCCGDKLGLGKITTIDYTPALLPYSLTDANSNVTRFNYDLNGQLTKETPPVGVPIRYEYNIAGQVTKKINDTTNQVLIIYGYDPQGRLTGRNYLDGAADAFTYNAAGQLATASNQNISYTFAYDGAGRLQSQSDNQGNVVNYAYDAVGRRSGLVVNNNAHTVTYGYTADKLTSITSSLAGAFGYGYDNLERRSSLTYPNGVTGAYSYNSDQPGWLAGISYQGTLPVYSVSYPTFDKVGNRTAKNEGALITFGYDAVYRLLNSTAGEVFTYDAVGNRLTDAARLYTVTAGNVMTAAGSISYTYDTFGNTLTAGPWTYGWNSTGMMTTATNGSTAESYAYDPFGRRIGKTANGATTSYVYDGQDIAASISGGATTHYVHGPGTDEHLAMFRSGAPSFYHIDGLGSVARITDSTQTVVQSYFYDSFGNPSIGNPSYNQPYLFNGREYDQETGLNYHHARYLNLQAGRWLSRDPASFAAGDVNLYGFVQNNSINNADSSGLFESNWLLRVLVPGQVAFDNVMTALEYGNYGQAVLNAVAMAGEQYIAVASFGQSGAVKQAGVCAQKSTRTVIGRVKDLQDLQEGEQSLLSRLPDRGNPKANWRRNSGVLRSEMQRDLPIRDASPGDMKGPFLNAERHLLQDRGWKFDSHTNYWNPPKP